MIMITTKGNKSIDPTSNASIHAAAAWLVEFQPSHASVGDEPIDCAGEWTGPVAALEIKRALAHFATL